MLLPALQHARQSVPSPACPSVHPAQFWHQPHKDWDLPDYSDDIAGRNNTKHRQNCPDTAQGGFRSLVVSALHCGAEGCWFQSCLGRSTFFFFFFAFPPAARKWVCDLSDEIKVVEGSPRHDAPLTFTDSFLDLFTCLLPTLLRFQRSVGQLVYIHMTSTPTAQILFDATESDDDPGSRQSYRYWRYIIFFLRGQACHNRLRLKRLKQRNAWTQDSVKMIVAGKNVFTFRPLIVLVEYTPSWKYYG